MIDEQGLAGGRDGLIHRLRGDEGGIQGAGEPTGGGIRDRELHGDNGTDVLAHQSLSEPTEQVLRLARGRPARVEHYHPQRIMVPNERPQHVNPRRHCLSRRVFEIDHTLTA